MGKVLNASVALLLPNGGNAHATGESRACTATVNARTAAVEQRSAVATQGATPATPAPR